MTARYFAYGSNMSAEVMRSWCPEARVLGVARLGGYRFDLRRRSIRWRAGVADLVAEPGGEVWGVVYELPETALDALDEKEGVRIGAYERISVRVELAAEGEVVAVAYTVVEKTPQRIAPDPDYAAVLVEAAKAADLPADYQLRLATVLSG